MKLLLLIAIVVVCFASTDFDDVVTMGPKGAKAAQQAMDAENAAKDTAAAMKASTKLHTAQLAKKQNQLKLMKQQQATGQTKMQQLSSKLAHLNKTVAKVSHDVKKEQKKVAVAAAAHAGAINHVHDVHKSVATSIHQIKHQSVDQNVALKHLTKITKAETKGALSAINNKKNLKKAIIATNKVEQIKTQQDKDLVKKHFETHKQQQKAAEKQLQAHTDAIKQHQKTAKKILEVHQKVIKQQQKAAKIQLDNHKKVIKQEISAKTANETHKKVIKQEKTAKKADEAQKEVIKPSKKEKSVTKPSKNSATSCNVHYVPIFITVFSSFSLFFFV